MPREMTRAWKYARHGVGMQDDGNVTAQEYSPPAFFENARRTKKNRKSLWLILCIGVVQQV
jgi:hypothetical protein